MVTTVNIVSPKGPLGYVTINESDFDPAKDKLFQPENLRVGADEDGKLDIHTVDLTHEDAHELLKEHFTVKELKAFGAEQFPDLALEGNKDDIIDALIEAGKTV